MLKRSIELGPDEATTHHDLGGVLLSLGRTEEAIGAFREAVRLEPNFVSAHQFLGFSLDNVGRRRDAVAAYETAVKLNPDLEEARSRLAELYVAGGRRPDAAAAYRALVQSTDRLAQRRFYEAQALDAEGKTGQAIQAMRALVESVGPSDHLLVRLAWMLAHVGRIEEAEELFLRATAAPAAPAMIWYGYASIHTFTSADQTIIARMNATLARPKLSSLDRQTMHFALGKAHDNLGQYAIAMRNFDAGNRLRSRQSSFDPALFARLVDRTIAAFQGDSFNVRKGLADSTPVLIVGMPRSGTTLVEQILSSHPKVAAGGELHFWPDHDTPEAGLQSAGEEVDHSIGAEYVAALRAISPSAERVTDKMPFNFGLLGVIGRIFPHATFIHCRRHPIDTCLSIFTTMFEDSMEFGSSRRNLVSYYRQYQRLMDHWRRALPAGRLVELDYEDLVADPEAASRQLVSACGLDWDDACLSPQLNRRTVTTASFWQARQPVYRSSVERWRRYEPWLGELRELDPVLARK